MRDAVEKEIGIGVAASDDIWGSNLAALVVEVVDDEELDDEEFDEVVDEELDEEMAVDEEELALAMVLVLEDDVVEVALVEDAFVDEEVVVIVVFLLDGLWLRRLLRIRFLLFGSNWAEFAESLYSDMSSSPVKSMLSYFRFLCRCGAAMRASNIVSTFLQKITVFGWKFQISKSQLHVCRLQHYFKFRLARHDSFCDQHLISITESQEVGVSAEPGRIYRGSQDVRVRADSVHISRVESQDVRAHSRTRSRSGFGNAKDCAAPQRQSTHDPSAVQGSMSNDEKRDIGSIDISPVLQHASSDNNSSTWRHDSVPFPLSKHVVPKSSHDRGSRHAICVYHGCRAHCASTEAHPWLCPRHKPLCLVFVPVSHLPTRFQTEHAQYVAFEQSWFDLQIHLRKAWCRNIPVTSVFYHRLSLTATNSSQLPSSVSWTHFRLHNPGLLNLRRRHAERACLHDLVQQQWTQFESQQVKLIHMESEHHYLQYDHDSRVRRGLLRLDILDSMLFVEKQLEKLYRVWCISMFAFKIHADIYDFRANLHLLASMPNRTLK